MGENYTEEEINIIKNYGHNPETITSQEIINIKEKELEKCFSYLEEFENKYRERKEKLDKIDPTYFTECVELGIGRVKENLTNYNPKQIPISFFVNSFKTTIKNLNTNLSIELDVRITSLKITMKAKNMK